MPEVARQILLRRLLYVHHPRQRHLGVLAAVHLRPGCDGAHSLLGRVAQRRVGDEVDLVEEDDVGAL
jgi:hypothetical protein